MNWFSIGKWAEAFWDFLTPTYLFLDAQSPAYVGLFLSPVGALMVYGTYAIASRDGTDDSLKPAARVCVGGFLVALLAAAAFKEPRATRRAVAIVPFVVLLATAGASKLWATKSPLRRAVVILLLVAVPVQFSTWYRHSTTPDARRETQPKARRTNTSTSLVLCNRIVGARSFW